MRPHELSASEAARAIAERRLGVLELAEDCLQVIEAQEAQVAAFAYIDPEQVREQAKRLDNQRPVGALHGVPIGIKDIMDTADMPTGMGSAIYAGHRPRLDAAAVALLRRSGALLMGKTVTTEFAYLQPAKTRNPHHLAHSPGGSSSGSAAAVAAGMVPLALGTQTAGSLIRPAAYCGVVGYKPSFGDYPLAGVKGLAPSFDTLGSLSRTVEDACLLRRVLLADASLACSDGQNRPPSIALCRTPAWQQADADSQNGLEQLLQRFSACGARVGEVELPTVTENFARWHTSLMTYEAARSLAAEHACREQLSLPLQQLLDGGQSLTYAQYREIHRLTAAGRQACGGLFAHWDVLLTPSAASSAPLKSEGTGDPLFSRLWMLLGVPSISLPLLSARNGLPIGAQLIGACHADNRLLRAALWVERHIGFPQSP